MASVFEGLLGRSLSEIFGFGIGTALGNALAPESTQLAQESWGITPLLVLDAGTAAQLVRLGRLSFDDGLGDAKQTGINGERFQHLIDASKSPPSTGELLELLRRRKLGADVVREAIERAGMDERYADDYLSLAKVLLSPEALAMMRQQSFVTAQEHLDGSALQGVDERDANLLFEISGEPPGAEFMVDMWRRGKATEDEVRQAIIEGRTKLKWTDVVLASKEIPLSVSLAVEAVVRQRQLPKDPHYYADAAGVSHADFDAWVDLSGRPMPTGEALTLARRGEFTEAQFTEVVARSDVRTEYAQDMWKLRRVIPPLFQVLRLIAAGSITDELAIQYITEDGYDKVLADAIVHAGHKGKTAKTHELTLAQDDIEYESGLQTEQWLTDRLVAHGYTASEAALHIEYLDAKLVYAAHQASIRRIHALYVTHKIDDATMQADLDALNINVRVKELLVHEWVGERDENVADLTSAEIGQAMRYGVISRDDAISRWQRHGYTLENATIKADIIQRVRRVPAGV